MSQISSGSMKAADILAELKTVDGADSGLDADKVRGVEFSPPQDYTPGTVLIIQDAAEEISDSTSYVKLKEFSLLRGGVVSTSFSLRRGALSADAYARIYVDGVAAGTQRSTSSTSNQTYTENITIPTNAKVQLYARVTTTPSRQSIVSNFKLLAANAGDVSVTG